MLIIAGHIEVDSDDRDESVAVMRAKSTLTAATIANSGFPTERAPLEARHSGPSGMFPGARKVSESRGEIKLYPAPAVHQEAREAPGLY